MDTGDTFLDPFSIHYLWNIRNSSTHWNYCLIKYLFNATWNFSLSLIRLMKLDIRLKDVDSIIISTLLKISEVSICCMKLIRIRRVDTVQLNWFENFLDYLNEVQ
jgi:hypothetical protein